MDPRLNYKSQANRAENEPSERSAYLRSKITLDPWDTEAHQELLRFANTRNFSIAQEYYDIVLKQFPTASKFWLVYVEHSLKHNSDFDYRPLPYANINMVPSSLLLKEGKSTIEIQLTALRYCRTSVDLWTQYIAYIRHSGIRQDIITVYEDALDKVGLDIAAHHIWMHYIDWIKAWDAKTSLEENHRRDALRKLYQRAIRTPMHNVEQLWKEYENFENNSVNKDLAKGLLSEHHPKYLAARTEYRARRNRRDTVSHNLLAYPPQIQTKKDEQNVTAWIKMITTEKSNPHSLDASDLKRRVTFTFEQSLTALYRYPDAWIDAANYQKQQDSNNGAKEYLMRGLEAVPDCPWLHFSLISIYEEENLIQEAQNTFESLLNSSPSPLVYIQYMRFTRRILGRDAARGVFMQARKDPKNLSYQVFIAAAEIENHINKEMEVARNIYELGLKIFAENPKYILQYINFLWSTSDDKYLRVIFDRFLDTLPLTEESLEVWNMYIEYEKIFGSIKDIEKAEKRRDDLFQDNETKKSSDGQQKVPCNNALRNCLSRSSYLDLNPVNKDELSSIRRRVDIFTPEKELVDTQKIRSSREQNRGKSSGSRFSLEEGIKRLINSVAIPMGMPVVDVGFVMDLLAKTPNSFQQTPVARRSAVEEQSMRGNDHRRRRKREDDGKSSNKRSRNENEGEVQRTGVINKAPSKDVFRLRQAQKQSKTR